MAEAFHFINRPDLSGCRMRPYPIACWMHGLTDYCLKVSGSMDLYVILYPLINGQDGIRNP